MILDLLYGPNGWFTHDPPPDWWCPDLTGQRAPFPWFGGKSKVAHLVWDRFGEVKNYVEPFYATGAVLLGRPHAPVIETVNDYDGFVVNFWRSIQWAPDVVAEHAHWPVLEADLHARHKWLVARRDRLRARLLEDPTFYDARSAGWWVWGLCAWIGSGWCQGCASKQLPDLGARAENGKGGRGVHAGSMRLPHLGAGTGGEDDHACAHYGKGVHGKGMRLSQQLPNIAGNGPKTSHGNGVHGLMTRSRIHEVFRLLSERLRYVRITCGDFERILSPAVTWRHGTTGVFLDPPYPADAGSTGGIYSSKAHERDTFDRAFRYCLANGTNKDLRIALCYYEGTRSTWREGEAEWEGDVSEVLRGREWDIFPWKANGGYGGQGGTNENAARERIAFSPHCLRAAQGSLF